MAKKEKNRKETGEKNKHLEKAVMENSVALQRVLANLSLEISGLSKKLSKLLDLFESSAKALSEKDSLSEKNVKTEKEISEKLTGLLEQNKILARGLTLLHEKNPVPAETENVQQLQQIPRPLPQRKSVEMGEYQKSISSR
jgi:hypothetical protein